MKNNVLNFLKSEPGRIKLLAENPRKEELWQESQDTLSEQNRLIKEYQEKIVELEDVQASLMRNLQKKGSNYSAFVRSIIGKGVSLSLFHSLTVEEKKEILDASVKTFQNPVKTKKHVKMIFDLLYDDGVSRRNAFTSTERISRELELSGFKKNTKDKYDFNDDYFFAFPDKDGKVLFDDILEKEIIEFGFREKKQGKYPDVIIKGEKDIIIIEHKHIDESGGGQNKQIGELIDFIRFTPNKPHVHYVSYLTGLFSRVLIQPIALKNKKQRDTILKQLKQTPENEFVIEDLTPLLKSI